MKYKFDNFKCFLKILLSASSKKQIASMLIAGMSLLTGLVSAENGSLGKATSAVCASCHGTKGISSNPLIPNLAGQDANYLASQLWAFKSAVRKNESMQHVCKSWLCHR